MTKAQATNEFPHVDYAYRVGNEFLTLQSMALPMEPIVNKYKDKCFGYKFKWKKAGLSFERGYFLYCMYLSAPDRFDKPTHVPVDIWVMDFYRVNKALIDNSFASAERAAQATN
jgi:hypothetical protein